MGSPELGSERLALFERGKHALASGDLESAVRLLGRCVRELPGDPRPFMYLGVAHSQLGQQDRAEHYLREVVRLIPEAAYAHYNLGSHLAASGRPDEAEDWLRRALAIDPSYEKARAALIALEAIRPALTPEALGVFPVRPASEGRTSPNLAVRAAGVPSAPVAAPREAPTAPIFGENPGAFIRAAPASASSGAAVAVDAPEPVEAAGVRRSRSQTADPEPEGLRVPSLVSVPVASPSAVQGSDPNSAVQADAQSPPPAQTAEVNAPPIDPPPYLERGTPELRARKQRRSEGADRVFRASALIERASADPESLATQTPRDRSVSVGVAARRGVGVGMWWGAIAAVAAFLGSFSIVPADLYLARLPWVLGVCGALPLAGVAAYAMIGAVAARAFGGETMGAMLGAMFGLICAVVVEAFAPGPLWWRLARALLLVWVSGRMGKSAGSRPEEDGPPFGDTEA
jgi:hypothetical protein